MTVPTWKEWTELTKEQREYELHRVLMTLNTKIDLIPSGCAKQIKICQDSFGSKKDVGWNKWGVRIMFGTLLTAIFIYVIEKVV